MEEAVLQALPEALPELVVKGDRACAIKSEVPQKFPHPDPGLLADQDLLQELGRLGWDHGRVSAGQAERPQTVAGGAWVWTTAPTSGRAA